MSKAWTKRGFNIVVPTQKYLPVFPLDTPEIYGGFLTYLSAVNEQPETDNLFREYLGDLPEGTIVRENGPGPGALTGQLCDAYKFRVQACEPSAEARRGLAEHLDSNKIPYAYDAANVSWPESTRAVIISSCGAGETPLAQVQPEVILDRHLYYHLRPDVISTTIRSGVESLAQSWNSRFLCTLKGAETDDCAMLEHFGLPRYDLDKHISEVVFGSPKLRFERRTTRADIRPDSFDQAAMIAFFMLCDPVCADLYTSTPNWKAIANSRALVEWDGFLRYVEDNLWRGGSHKWDHHHIHYIVRRERLYSKLV